MKSFACICLVSLGLLSTCLAAEAPKKAAPANPDKLAGAYRIIDGERSSQKIASERLQEISVRITKDKFTTLDKAKKEFYVATYTIDRKHTPWRILMTATVTPDKSKGMEAAGLIEQNGDTVKLIYALPGGAEPTGFKTGDKQQMFVLKRAGL